MSEKLKVRAIIVATGLWSRRKLRRNKDVVSFGEFSRALDEEVELTDEWTDLTFTEVARTVPYNYFNLNPAPGLRRLVGGELCVFVPPSARAWRCAEKQRVEFPSYLV